MTASELSAKLIAEGCNGFCIGTCTEQTDVYCLDQDGVNWLVFYTERGLPHTPIFSSTSEEKAQHFFYQLITGMIHRHLVGFFRNEQHALALEQALQALAISSFRNDIPAYSGPNDPRFRVFVEGKDIFRVQAAMGELPKRDE